MTNRIEVNWKVDGFIDEQRYYRSLTTMDVNSMPPPKATIPAGVATYSDTDIVTGQTYFIRVSSVKGLVEKISNEVQIKASAIDPNYRIKLITQGGMLVDNGYSEFMWASSGSVNYSTGNEISFADGAYIKSDKVFTFNGDFDFEFDFYVGSSATNSYFGIVNNKEITWNSGGFQISVGGTSVGYETNKLFCGFYGSSSIVSSNDISRDSWNTARVTSVSGVYSVYLNGVQTSGSGKPTIADAIMVVGSLMSYGPIKIRNFKCK
ncbi:family 16 glycoside hydrolase [Acinetobacter courvalinii]|uniref:family 16 glycoside hydrolase n=1 Tax=Acinetobacter courvalinii TaxID=280147 RepID=UPI0039C8C933